MKTADLKIGDHVAYKTSKYRSTREAIVMAFRSRQDYGWDRASTVGVMYAELPEGRDPAEAVMWVRPQEIVSTWADELVRRAERRQATEAEQARIAAKIEANRHRLEAVEQLAEILASTSAGPLTEHQENRLLVGASFNAYIDLDKLEAIVAALSTEVTA